MMSAAFFACGFQLTFIAAHLPGYLAVCGLPPSVGATALALIGLFNAAGSYAAGALGSRYKQELPARLGFTCSGRPGGGGVYLLVPGVRRRPPWCSRPRWGLLWLSVAPLVSGLIGQMFGHKNFNALFRRRLLQPSARLIRGGLASGAQ